MNASKQPKYLHSVFALTFFFLLWNVVPASSFSQKNGEDGTSAGEKAGGLTMKTVSGKVVETMNSGGYTYALVDESGAKIWVALPKSNLAVGNEITCQSGMVMNNFSSSSLRRVFKNIVFSSGITSFSSGDASEVSPTPEETIVVPKIEEPKEWKDF